MADGLRYFASTPELCDDADHQDVECIEVDDTDDDYCEIVEEPTTTPITFKGRGIVTIASGLATPAAQLPPQAAAASTSLPRASRKIHSASAHLPLLVPCCSSAPGSGKPAVLAPQAAQPPAVTAEPFNNTEQGEPDTEGAVNANLPVVKLEPPSMPSNPNEQQQQQQQQDHGMMIEAQAAAHNQQQHQCDEMDVEEGLVARQAAEGSTAGNSIIPDGHKGASDAAVTSVAPSAAPAAAVAEGIHSMSPGAAVADAVPGNSSTATAAVSLTSVAAAPVAASAPSDMGVEDIEAAPATPANHAAAEVLPPPPATVAVADVGAQDILGLPLLLALAAAPPAAHLDSSSATEGTEKFIQGDACDMMIDAPVSTPPIYSAAAAAAAAAAKGSLAAPAAATAACAVVPVRPPHTGALGFISRYMRATKQQHQHHHLHQHQAQHQNQGQQHNNDIQQDRDQQSMEQETEEQEQQEMEEQEQQLSGHCDCEITNVSAAAAASQENKYMEIHAHLPRRSAAARAEQLFRQQLQARRGSSRKPSAAESAAADRVKQGRMSAEVDRRELQRMRRVFGDDGFLPVKPHDAMRENGDILEPGKVFAAGRLIAKARQELDAGGERSHTYHMYNELVEGGRWSVAQEEDQLPEAPLTKLVDLQCLLGQQLVYSCKPLLTGVRSQPVADEELMSACCRAEVVPTKKNEIGNDIKCLNPDCNKHPTWERWKYERRHLKLTLEAQNHPFYNSPEHWVLEQLGMSLKGLALAVSAGHLNTFRCIFCNHDVITTEIQAAAAKAEGKDPDPDCLEAPPTDSIKPCSTCPMACHKTCYKAFTGDCQLPDDDTPEDDDFWQCLSCREAEACAAAGCTWCKETSPHLRHEHEYMEEQYNIIEQDVAQEAAAAAAEEQQQEEDEGEQAEEREETHYEADVADAGAAAAALQRRKRASKVKSSAAGKKRFKPEMQRQHVRRKRRRVAAAAGESPGGSSSEKDSDTDSESDGERDEVEFAGRLTAAEHIPVVENFHQRRFYPCLLAARQMASPGKHVPGPAAAAAAGSSRAAGADSAAQTAGCTGPAAHDAAAAAPAAGVGAGSGDGSAMLTPVGSEAASSSPLVAAAPAEAAIEAFNAAETRVQAAAGTRDRAAEDSLDAAVAAGAGAVPAPGEATAEPEARGPAEAAAEVPLSAGNAADAAADIAVGAAQELPPAVEATDGLADAGSAPDATALPTAGARNSCATADGVRRDVFPHNHGLVNQAGPFTGPPAEAATMSRLMKILEKAEALRRCIKQGADPLTSKSCREAMTCLRLAEKGLALMQGDAVSQAVKQQRDVWLKVYGSQIEEYHDDLVAGGVDEGWKQDVLKLLKDI